MSSPIEPAPGRHGQGAGQRGPRISRRVAAIAESATLAIDARAKALKAMGEDVIAFGAGEPDFPTPAHVVEAAAAATHQPRFHHYTPTAGLPELREAVAAKTARDSGYRVEPAQVLVTNGGKQAIYEAFATLLDPGDEVLVPAPYWVTYPEAIALAGGVPVFVPTDASTGFRTGVERLEAARTPRTKVLLFVSPSNPTVAVYGVAKTYAMTGWRVGWMLGPADVVKAAANLQSHATSNVCHVAQAAALAAVSGPLHKAVRMREAFDRRCRRIHELLAALTGVTCMEPQGAFYAFPSVSGVLGRRIHGRRPETAMELADLILEEARVAIVPGEAFGAPGYARLSYALGDDDLVEGITRIAKLLREAAWLPQLDDHLDLVAALGSRQRQGERGGLGRRRWRERRLVDLEEVVAADGGPQALVGRADVVRQGPVVVGGRPERRPPLPLGAGHADPQVHPIGPDLQGQQHQPPPFGDLHLSGDRDHPRQRGRDGGRARVLGAKGRRRGADEPRRRALLLPAPVHDLDHLLPEAWEVGAELDEHLGRHALALADEAEQDVLGADVVVAEIQRLAQAQLQDLLGARRERDVPARGAVAPADDLLDLRADPLQRHAADPPQRLGGGAFALVEQAEQEVLGADVVVVQEPGLLLGEHDHSPGPVGATLANPQTPTAGGAMMRPIGSERRPLRLSPSWRRGVRRRGRPVGRSAPGRATRRRPRASGTCSWE